MGAIQSLPAGYREIYSIDLQKDKKAATFVNVFSILIAAAMVVTANVFLPVSSLFSMKAGLLHYFIRFFVLIASTAAYMCLHELIHGMTMKACGTQKVRYGFTGLYFFAASDDYYGKKDYITIALAPVVVFLLVLIPVNAIVPRDWFWVVYFLQVCNIAGSAGDLFVSVRFARMPKTIMIRDGGTGMVVYARGEV